MSTPDPNADRARRFANDFNIAAAHDDAAGRAREIRRKLNPDLTEEELDALAARDERLGRYGPKPSSDAIGIPWPPRA